MKIFLEEIKTVSAREWIEAATLCVLSLGVMLMMLLVL